MPDIAIFAVTNRTGSTLLQRIFNANPDTMVWGENGRALTGFASIQEGTLHFSRAQANVRQIYFGEKRPMDVDISCMTPAEPVVNQASLGAVRAYFNILYPKTAGKRIGFKEVSHPPNAVDLFQAAFPEAMVVFLARHPVSAWRSLPPTWKVSLDEFIASWKLNVKGYAERGNLFWFEDLISDRITQDVIADLAKVTRKSLEEVLSIKVSSTAANSTRDPLEFSKIMVECGDMIPPHVASRIDSSICPNVNARGKTFWPFR